MTRGFLLAALLLIGLAGCGPNYSPNTYSTTAVRQANKADQGVVVGVRQVRISSSGSVGSITGAAAGGIAGAQLGDAPVTAFSALGGSLVGGLAGSAMEHATSDTTAYEYIIRKTNAGLVSVTQKDAVPLALGERVLVIAGNQARVIPNFSLAPPVPPNKPGGVPPSKPGAAQRVADAKATTADEAKAGAAAPGEPKAAAAAVGATEPVAAKPAEADAKTSTAPVGGS